MADDNFNELRKNYGERIQSIIDEQNRLDLTFAIRVGTDEEMKRRDEIIENQAATIARLKEELAALEDSGKPDRLGKK